jgi:hypothetical protein
MGNGNATPCPYQPEAFANGEVVIEVKTGTPLDHWRSSGVPVCLLLCRISTEDVHESRDS